MKFDDEEGLLKRIGSVLNAFRPDCTIIRGRHLTGQRITFLRCGGTHPVENRFFIGKILSELDEERPIGKIPFWRLRKIAKEAKVDFTLIHLDQALAWAAETLIKRAGSEVFRTPLFLETVVDLSDEKKLLSGSNLKRDIQRIQKNAFSIERTTEPADLLTFIRKFRDPYVAKRHPLDAPSYRYDPAIFTKKSLEGSGFSLLKIMHEGQWVAGEVIADSFQGRPALWELGVKDGDTHLVRQGALAAAYWLSIEFLIQQGAQSVSFARMRPYINEGVLKYKSKFKPTVTNNSSRRVLIVPNLSSQITRDVLVEEPFIIEEGGKLIPLGFSKSHCVSDGLEPHSVALHRYKNLEAARLIKLPENTSTTNSAQPSQRTPASTHSDYPRDKCIHDLFCENALQHLDQAAVRYEEEILSYAHLLESSERLAQNLRQNGIGNSDVVAVCADRSLHLPTWVLGVLRSGAAYLPLDPALPSERLQFMLKDAGARALIVDEKTKELFKGATLPCPLIVGSKAISRESNSDASVLPNDTTSSDLAYIIYTSGSTGLPKGVEIEHRNIVNLVWDMKERLGLRQKESVLSIGSFAFDVTLPDWFWAFLTGGTVIIADEQSIKDPARLVPLISKHRPTHIQATPGTWEMLLKVGLPSYRPLRLVTTGEHVGEALRERLRNLSDEVWNLYGPTETTVWSSACHLGHDHSAESIGTPIANTQFHIVGDNGQPASDNERGELWIGGEGVARGYLSRIELTDERFVTPDWAPGRLYRTGDLVEWNPEGGVRYLGRIDDQVKIRGYRIELGEIDAKLSEHSDVQVSQTLLVEGEHSPRLVSFVVPKSNDTDPKDWKTFLLSELPAYMVPARFIPLKALPLTPNGKIDRKALQAHLKTTPDGSVKTKLNALERKVANVWRSVLKGPQITSTDTFWDLGGDSLSAVHMLLELKQRLGLEVPYERLSENPTLSEFCAFCTQRKKAPQRLRSLRSGSDPVATPILFTHGHNFCNTIDELSPVIHSLDAFHPIWGLSGHGEDGRCWSYQTLPDMAAEALELIKGALPPQRIILAGYCIGGLLAYELAKQLSEAGYEIEHVIMIDTATPELRNTSIAEGTLQRRQELKDGLRHRSLSTLIERIITRVKFERKYFQNSFWRHVAPFWIRFSPLPSQARTPYYQSIQSAAFTSYEPGKLDAPVHLIKTDQNSWPPDYGWGPHCPQIEESFLSAPPPSRNGLKRASPSACETYSHRSKSEQLRTMPP